MDVYFTFISNNPVLFLLFFVILGFIIFKASAMPGSRTRTSHNNSDWRRAQEHWGSIHVVCHDPGGEERRATNPLAWGDKSAGVMTNHMDGFPMLLRPPPITIGPGEVKGLEIRWPDMVLVQA